MWECQSVQNQISYAAADWPRILSFERHIKCQKKTYSLGPALCEDLCDTTLIVCIPNLKMRLAHDEPTCCFAPCDASRDCDDGAVLGVTGRCHRQVNTCASMLPNVAEAAAPPLQFLLLWGLSSTFGEVQDRKGHRQ